MITTPLRDEKLAVAASSSQCMYWFSSPGLEHPPQIAYFCGVPFLRVIFHTHLIESSSFPQPVWSGEVVKWWSGEVVKWWDLPLLHAQGKGLWHRKLPEAYGDTNRKPDLVADGASSGDKPLQKNQDGTWNMSLWKKKRNVVAAKSSIFFGFMLVFRGVDDFHIAIL